MRVRICRDSYTPMACKPLQPAIVQFLCTATVLESMDDLWSN